VVLNFDDRYKIDKKQVNPVKTINDPQLGDIEFQKNRNARNYIIRLLNGKVKVTVPLYGNYDRAKEFLFENKQNLIRKIQKQTIQPVPDIDEIALRRKAQSVLPVRLAELAVLHGFQ
jgi:predicted metal-dependent hydrolase